MLATQSGYTHDAAIGKARDRLEGRVTGPGAALKAIYTAYSKFEPKRIAVTLLPSSAAGCGPIGCQPTQF